MRSRRGPVRRVPDQHADPAHQPRNHPSRRRNRLHPRPLRQQRRDEGEVANARHAPTRQGRAPDALIEFLRLQQNAFFAIAYGLTDEQARSTPSVSALSIGGLIKHVAGVQRGWMERVAAAPEFAARDDRPFEEQARGIPGPVRDARRRNPRAAARHVCARRTRTRCGSSARPISTPRFPFRTTCRGSRRTSTAGTCAGWRCT